MKPLRLLVLGLAIGVLATLVRPQAASAAMNPPRDNARQLRPVTAFPGTAASRSTYPHPPARRPGPQHPNRSARTTSSHPRLTKRPRVNDHATALGIQPNADALAAAWRIGFFRSLSFQNRDGSVISGRGPPRAGPIVLRDPSLGSQLAALPRPLAFHPSASLYGSARSTRLSSTASVPRSTVVSDPNPIRSIALRAASPSRAAGQEGAPARNMSPSVGEQS